MDSFYQMEKLKSGSNEETSRPKWGKSSQNYFLRYHKINDSLDRS